MDLRKACQINLLLILVARITVDTENTRFFLFPPESALSKRLELLSYALVALHHPIRSRQYAIGGHPKSPHRLHTAHRERHSKEGSHLQ